MADPQTLAQAVKAKHPGEYDNWSDVDLEKAIIAKHPGEYNDWPLSKPEQGRPIVDLRAGAEAAKGVVNAIKETTGHDNPDAAPFLQRWREGLRPLHDVGEAAKGVGEAAWQTFLAMAPKDSMQDFNRAAETAKYVVGQSSPGTAAIKDVAKAAIGLTGAEVPEDSNPDTVARSIGRMAFGVSMLGATKAKPARLGMEVTRTPGGASIEPTGRPQSAFTDLRETIGNIFSRKNVAPIPEPPVAPEMFTRETLKAKADEAARQTLENYGYGNDVTPRLVKGTDRIPARPGARTTQAVQNAINEAIDVEAAIRRRKLAKEAIGSKLKNRTPKDKIETGVAEGLGEAGRPDLPMSVELPPSESPPAAPLGGRGTSPGQAGEPAPIQYRYNMQTRQYEAVPETERTMVDTAGRTRGGTYTTGGKGPKTAAEVGRARIDEAFDGQDTRRAQFDQLMDQASSPLLSHAEATAALTKAHDLFTETERLTRPRRIEKAHQEAIDAVAREVGSNKGPVHTGTVEMPLPGQQGAVPPRTETTLEQRARLTADKNQAAAETPGTGKPSGQPAGKVVTRQELEVRTTNAVQKLARVKLNPKSTLAAPLVRLRKLLTEIKTLTPEQAKELPAVLRKVMDHPDLPAKNKKQLQEITHWDAHYAAEDARARAAREPGAAAATVASEAAEPVRPVTSATAAVEPVAAAAPAAAVPPIVASLERENARAAGQPGNVATGPAVATATAVEPVTADSATSAAFKADVSRLHQLLQEVNDFDPSDRVAASRSQEARAIANKAMEDAKSASTAEDVNKIWASIKRGIDVLEGNAGGEAAGAERVVVDVPLPGFGEPITAPADSIVARSVETAHKIALPDAPRAEPTPQDVGAAANEVLLKLREPNAAGLELGESIRASLPAGEKAAGTLDKFQAAEDTGTPEGVSRQTQGMRIGGPPPDRPRVEVPQFAQREGLKLQPPAGMGPRTGSMPMAGSPVTEAARQQLAPFREKVAAEKVVKAEKGPLDDLRTELERTKGRKVTDKELKAVAKARGIEANPQMTAPDLGPIPRRELSPREQRAAARLTEARAEHAQQLAKQDGPPPDVVERFPHLTEEQHQSTWDAMNALADVTREQIELHGIKDNRSIDAMRRYFGARETGRLLRMSEAEVREMSGPPHGKRPLREMEIDMDRRYRYLLADPKGFMNTEILLAGSAVLGGALIGGAMYDGEDVVDRMSWMLSGALIGGAGVGAVVGARRVIPKVPWKSTWAAVEAMDSANLLAGAAVLKASLGSFGGVAAGMAERLAEGRTADFKRGVNAAWREATGEYYRTLTADTSVLQHKMGAYAGQVQVQMGLAGLPNKVLTTVLRPFIAADAAGEIIMKRMGYTAAETERMMLLGTPTTHTGQAALSLINSNLALRTLMKFSRVRIGTFERGLEYTPIVGQLVNTRSVRRNPSLTHKFIPQEGLSSRARVARQVFGGGAMVAGGVFGYWANPTNMQLGIVASGIGPMALPFTAAAKFGQSLRKNDVAKAAGDAVVEYGSVIPKIDEADIRQLLPGEGFAPGKRFQPGRSARGLLELMGVVEPREE